MVVRGNTFLRCGKNDGLIDNASSVAVQVNAAKADVAGMHKRILIENNLVVGGAPHAFSIRSAEDVTIRDNRFSDIPADPIVIRDSHRVTVRGNAGAPDVAVP